MNRYWLSVGDGQTYGPYTVEELRAFMVEGRVHAGCSLCEQTENESASSAWVPAPTILSGLASLTPPTPPLHFSAKFPVNSPANSSARRIGYLWSTCVTLGTLLFCCLPVGVGAVFAAAQANAKYAAGDLVGLELGIGLTHLVDERRHQRVEEGLSRAQLVAMPDGSAGDAA